MTGFSTYFQTQNLNWIKGTTMPAAPAAIYVALFSADPTDAGALTNEVTTTIRPAGRPVAAFGVVSTATGSSSIANNADVDFGTAAGGATVTYFGIFDAVSAGNMIGSGTIASGTVTTGLGVKFLIGVLVVSSS